MVGVEVEAEVEIGAGFGTDFVVVMGIGAVYLGP